MKRSAPKTLILAVGILIGIMLTAGCEEEKNLSDTKPDAKRSRLIAVENAQLKKQIEELKKQHIKEMDMQKKLLDNCLRDKKTYEDMSKKGLENYMQDILGPIAEENTKLREEIKALKAQLEEAKK
jgi:hypothetical protein